MYHPTKKTKQQLSSSKDGPALQKRHYSSGFGEITRKAWTQEELSIIRKYYPIEGDAIVERLPDRTLTACQMKAYSIGLRKLDSANRRRRWTQKEDLILQEYYPHEGTLVARRMPYRTKSAILNRVKRLGLCRDFSGPSITEYVKGIRSTFPWKR